MAYSLYCTCILLLFLMQSVLCLIMIMRVWRLYRCCGLCYVLFAMAVVSYRYTLLQPTSNYLSYYYFFLLALAVFSSSTCCMSRKRSSSSFNFRKVLRMCACLAFFLACRSIFVFLLLIKCALDAFSLGWSLVFFLQWLWWRAVLFWFHNCFQNWRSFLMWQL